MSNATSFHLVRRPRIVRKTSSIIRPSLRTSLLFTVELAVRCLRLTPRAEGNAVPGVKVQRHWAAALGGESDNGELPLSRSDCLSGV